MKFFPRPLQLLALLAITFLAACGSDSTGANPDRIEGTYNVSTVAVPQGGSTVNRPVPAVLWEGAATANGQQYNIRVELVSASIALTDQGSRYTYTGRFRYTETNGRLPVNDQTVTESGTYILFGDDISFMESLNSEIHIGAGGTIRKGTIVVDADDPIFDDSYTLTFKR